VIVPFYNVESYIQDCLESIALQTYSDFEVVLVDDGSPDDSVQIAKEFCNRDPRFHLVRQENQGLGPARNTGVEHSSGEFITFVDSDDLVTAHASERMIASLDETGSSFAAGNARRFNNSGVRPSYVHRIPFATARPATHVSLFPQLALDRMVWNKLYRRTFWDEFGYRFPAIRYEDYPVTLKAHLDAVTVDVLSTPVYYWRERESGDSITQQKFQYFNLLDRVISAELVLDLVDERAPDLAARVHRHLAEIDLRALVQAFAVVPDEDVQLLVNLGRRFTGRLRRAALAGLSAYDVLQLRALHDGHVDLLRRLALYRQDGGLLGGARARRRTWRPWQWEYQFPGRTDKDRPVPRSLYRAKQTDLNLRTSITAVHWSDNELRLTGTADIRHVRTGDRSRLGLTLVGDDIRVRLAPPRRFRTLDSHGSVGPVGFDVGIPIETLRTIRQAKRPPYLEVDLRRGWLRRRKVLTGLLAGSPSWSPGDWIGDDTWLQPSAGTGGRLSLRSHTHPCAMTSATVVEDAIVVRIKLPEPDPNARLMLTRATNGANISVDLVPDGGQLTGRIELPEVVGSSGPDDPYLRHTVWAVRVETGGDQSLVLLTGWTRSLIHVRDSRMMTLTRSPAGYVTLIDSPIRLVATDATIEDAAGDPGQLYVSGPAMTADPTWRFCWRRFLLNSDDYVEIESRDRATDTRWMTETDLARILDATPPHHGIPHTWGLFAVDSDCSAIPVAVDPFLASRLPLATTRSVVVRPRTGTFYLEVH
jgi:CDP-glycerol glycerophosphotransferase